MIFGFQHHFTLSVTFFALKKYGVPHCLQNQSLFIRLCIYIVLSNYCSKSQQGGLHGEISRSSNHFERESLQNGRRGTACLFLPCFLTLVSGYVTIWNLQTEALYHWFSYSYTGSSHKWSLYLQTIVYLLVIKFHCVEFTSWENICRHMVPVLELWIPPQSTIQTKAEKFVVLQKCLYCNSYSPKGSSLYYDHLLCIQNVPSVFYQIRTSVT